VLWYSKLLCIAVCSSETAILLIEYVQVRSKGRGKILSQQHTATHCNTLRHNATCEDKRAGLDTITVAGSFYACLYVDICMCVDTCTRVTSRLP